MRYVVTGGAGFIGSHLVEHLAGAGADVVVLDDFSTGKRANLAPWIGKITVIEGSITEAADCARAIAGADYVLHQAAVPSVPRSVADPVRSHAVNATGTLNVLAAARDARVKRVVYAASSSAYGDTAEAPEARSDGGAAALPLRRRQARRRGLLPRLPRVYGLPAISLRYFNVFGPRQDPDSQYAAVVPKFITAALAGSAPVIYGDGGQTRDFTYVENVVAREPRRVRRARAAFGEVSTSGCGERLSIARAVDEDLGAGRPVDRRPATSRRARATCAIRSPPSIARARSSAGRRASVSMRDSRARSLLPHAGAELTGARPAAAGLARRSARRRPGHRPHRARLPPARRLHAHRRRRAARVDGREGRRPPRSSPTPRTR